MMELTSEKVYSFTEEATSLSAPCTMIVGVSGGADSMCLLHLACTWREKGVSPIAVHIAHGIRDDEARRDADFVREQCARWKVPLYVVRADVPAIAEKEHCGLEEAGRLVRYAVFERVKKQTNAACILTAHTASDQAETVLLHMIRGCGVAGLSGIPLHRDGIVRPLLPYTRSAVEEYCKDHALPYVIDSTNEDTRYTRNAVRHKVLPLLKSLNPAVLSAILRLSRTAARDEDYMAAEAKTALASAALSSDEYRRSAFLSQHEAIRYRMLRQALEERGCRSMEERHFCTLSQMMGEGHGGVALPGGYTVLIGRETVRIVRETARADTVDPLMIDKLPFSADFGCFSLRLFRCTPEDCEQLKKVHKMFFKYTIDYDTIQGGLQVRCRQIGDHIHPVGRGIGKSVKALMNECRIPAQTRDAFPILCDDGGVVMLPGYCCDERVRTREHTKHFLVCLIESLPT